MKSSSNRAAVLLFSSIVGVTFFHRNECKAVTLTADYSGLGTVYQDAAANSTPPRRPVEPMSLPSSNPIFRPTSPICKLPSPFNGMRQSTFS